MVRTSVPATRLLSTTTLTGIAAAALLAIAALGPGSPRASIGGGPFRSALSPEQIMNTHPGLREILHRGRLRVLAGEDFPALRPDLTRLSRAQLRQVVGAIGAAHDVPAELFVALVMTESSFDPAARSPVGAIGLAQLMPATARELGVDPHDPWQNLEGGARYLRAQFNRFGNWRLALAAYNAGPSRVARLGRIPRIRETQEYVRKIMTRAGRLRATA